MNAQAALRTTAAFGYRGDKVEFIEWDVAVFVVGNALKVLNVKTGEESFVFSPHEVACFTVNAKYGLIAYANAALSPLIHVLSYPSMELVVTLQNGTVLEYVDLAFSRDGMRLASLGAEPDFTLAVWNWEREEMIVAASLPDERRASHVSFNPRSSDVLCTSGPSGMVFWKLDMGFSSATLVPKQATGLSDTLLLPETDGKGEVLVGDSSGGGKSATRTHRTMDKAPTTTSGSVPSGKGGKGASSSSSSSSPPPPPPDGSTTVSSPSPSPSQPLTPLSGVLCHAWTVDSTVLVGTSKGELGEYSAATGEGRRRETLADPITTLALTRGFMVFGCADGCLRWYDLSRHIISQILRVGRESLDLTSRSSPALRNISFSPDYTRLVVGLQDALKLVVLYEEESGSAGVAGTRRGASDNLFVEELGTFHAGTVTGIASIPGQAVIATVSDDGSLRLWNYTTRACLSVVTVSGGDTRALTSISASKVDGLLAVGSETGVVRFYDVSDSALPRLISRFKPLSHPISFLAFNPSGTVLAVASLAAPYVYLIDTSLTAPANVGGGPILGYTSVAANVVGLSWITVTKGASPQLLVACHESVTRMEVPPRDALLDHMEFVRKSDLSKALLKTDFPIYTVTALPPSLSSSRCSFFTLAHDRRLKQYTMAPDAADPDLVEDSDITPPELEAPGHERRGGLVCISPDGRWLASAAADGLLSLRPALNVHAPHVVSEFSPRAGGVRALAFSYDSQYLFTAGAGGGVFIHTLTYAGWVRVPESDPGENPAIASVPTLVNTPSADLPSEPTVLGLAAANVAAAEAAVALSVQKAALERLHAVAESYHALAAVNSSAPTEAERLSREEFVIDEGIRDSHRAAGDARARVVKATLEAANVRRDYLHDVIKELCWDSMESPGASLTGLRSSSVVDSYPLRKLSAEEVSEVAQVKELRLLEEKELRARKAAALAKAQREAEEAAAATADKEKEKDQGTNSGGGGRASARGGGGGGGGGGGPAQNLAINRMAHPQRRRRASIAIQPGDEASLKASVLGSVSSGSGGGPPANVSSDEEDDKKDDDEGYVLYDPFDLYTSQRKRTQVLLLQSMIRARKEAFNKEFAAVLSAKHKTIATIEEANESMDAILHQLDLTLPLFHPKLSPSENPTSIFEVNDDEVQVERFVAPAERERLAALKRAEEEKLRAEKGDDSGERALKIMMGGRLEDKESEGLHVELERPEWMNKPKEQMTEEEAKLFKDFEAKEKEVQEKLEKQRRHLETKLKTLQASVDTEISNFDSELENLVIRRLETDSANYEDELSIIKYSQALLAEENAEERHRELNAMWETCNADFESLNTRASELAHETETRKEAYEAVLERERKLEKDFKRLIQSESPFDTFRDVLRRYWAASKRRANLPPPLYAKDEENPDPFADLDDEMLPSAAPIDEDVVPPVPEGMDAVSFGRFLEMRRVKLSLETEREAKNKSYLEASAFCENLIAQKDAAHAKLEAVKTSYTAFQEQRMMSALNLEILLKLKQGYVEVGEGGMLLNPQDIVLIDIKKVKAQNAIIRALGDKKLEILSEIKAVRKANHQLAWENRRLRLQADEVSDLVRAFQLLRVTKQHQELIKGGVGGITHSDRRRLEIEKLEEQLSSSRQAHFNKIEEKRLALLKVEKMVSEKESENSQLDDDLVDHATAVAEREEIYEVQQRRASGPELRMKAVAKRRKLVEVAKAQADEIAALRDEVERLTKRSFPSFKNVKHVV